MKNQMISSKIAIVDIDNTLWPFSDAFYLELKKINRAYASNGFRLFQNLNGVLDYILKTS